MSAGGWLIAAAALLVVAVLALPPFAQPLAYHAFADQRGCLGVANCADVLSNLCFLLAGAAGLRVLVGVAGRGGFIDARERHPYTAFFLAVVLIGFASAWYHLEPDNARLAWDRAAMALAFMAWLAAVITERVGLRIGLMLLPVLMMLGLAAVDYWATSELRGAGDLRPWLLAQALPMVLVPLVLWQFPARYSRCGDLLAVIALYGLVLLLDLGDRAVFELTGGIVGGHALKHAVAALAAWWVARYLIRRRPLRHLAGEGRTRRGV